LSNRPTLDCLSNSKLSVPSGFVLEEVRLTERSQLALVCVRVMCRGSISKPAVWLRSSFKRSRLHAAFVSPIDRNHRRGSISRGFRISFRRSSSPSWNAGPGASYSGPLLSWSDRLDRGSSQVLLLPISVEQNLVVSEEDCLRPRSGIDERTGSDTNGRNGLR
jgi:hypothetical protein